MKKKKFMNVPVITLRLGNNLNTVGSLCLDGDKNENCMQRRKDKCHYCFQGTLTEVFEEFFFLYDIEINT